MSSIGSGCVDEVACAFRLLEVSSIGGLRIRSFRRIGARTKGTALLWVLHGGGCQRERREVEECQRLVENRKPLFGGLKSLGVKTGAQMGKGRSSNCFKKSSRTARQEGKTVEAEELVELGEKDMRGGWNSYLRKVWCITERSWTFHWFVWSQGIGEFVQEGCFREWRVGERYRQEG